MDEFVHALAVRPRTRSLVADTILPMKLVLEIRCGLVAIDKFGTVRLAHTTTKEYLDHRL